MLNKLLEFAKDESGATAIEYGLIAALVSVAAIAALRGMGESLALRRRALGRLREVDEPASRIVALDRRNQGRGGQCPGLVYILRVTVPAKPNQIASLGRSYA